MKIFTCALLPFTANAAFFTRDSGLLCHALRDLGIESKVIMPSGPTLNHSDPDDVVRADNNEFRSENWWRSLDIDGVIFIAWGFRQHTSVIRAARQAGIQTCALFDCNGDPFPYSDFFSKPRLLWRKGKFIETFPLRLIGTLARTAFCGMKGISAQYFRSEQIGVPHIAAFQTPKTMERCLSVARLFPWIKSESRRLVVGYPIPKAPEFSLSANRRVNVISVARWDALRHKRPHMLMHVISEVTKIHKTVTFDIYGRTIPEMTQWHAQLDEEYKTRINIHGVKPSTEVMNSIASSQILYCPSIEEGVPLPVVEALCCGCSVAGLATPDVPGLCWAVSEGHGTSAIDDSVSSHANSILAELSLWDQNHRVANEISRHWQQWFSYSNVASRLIELLSRKS